MNGKLKALIYIVVFATIIFVIFTIISLYQTIDGKRLYERSFCLSSQCLENLAKEVSGITLYFQAFGYLMTTFVTVFGVIIALMTYYSGVKIIIIVITLLTLQCFANSLVLNFPKERVSTLKV